MTDCYKLGLGNRTVYDKLVVVLQMFKRFGKTKLIEPSDWPDYVEKIRPIYSPEEIRAMLKHAENDEGIFLKFLLGSGFRDRETQYVTWRDLDCHNSLVRVTAKPLFGFRPKNWEERAVPLPSALVEQLRAVRERRKALPAQLAGTNAPWRPGIHFASLYVDDPAESQVFDYLPESLMDRVRNLADFARVLVLDRWACNCDGRQAVFSRRGKRSRGYFATFIDQGYCFNAGEWSFPDSPLRGVYARNSVYRDVTTWDSFEPALTRAEQINIDAIWEIAADIPKEWYESDQAGLTRLVETLYRRRGMIRDLISAFRSSTREPFPNWKAN